MQSRESEHSDPNELEEDVLETEASDIFEWSKPITLSERDTLLVLDLLENPPPPSAKLIAALKAWKEDQRRLQQMEQATDDQSRRTGADLIEFFRNSPLAF